MVSLSHCHRGITVSLLTSGCHCPIVIGASLTHCHWGVIVALSFGHHCCIVIGALLSHCLLGRHYPIVIGGGHCCIVIGASLLHCHLLLGRHCPMTMRQWSPIDNASMTAQRQRDNDTPWDNETENCPDDNGTMKPLLHCHRGRHSRIVIWASFCNIWNHFASFWASFCIIVLSGSLKKY